MRSLWMVLVPLLAASAEVKAQDAAAGERVFNRCGACHQVGESARSGVGPQLNGLFGRRARTVPGYAYSPANKASDITWSDETFSAYIKDPKAAMPGNKMVFPGVKDDADIARLTAFLKQFPADGRKP